MKRMLPFRDINPHDVVNMFAINSPNSAITDSGNGDDGVVVSILSGNLANTPVEYKTDTFLGYAGGPNVGFNAFPHVKLKIKAAASTEIPVGITLKETANLDENGLKLIYNKDKKDSIGCVTSGEATPIFKKGLATFTYRAFGVGTDKSYVPAPGTRLVQSATAGLMTGITEATFRSVVTGSGTAFLPSLGTVIATGTAYSLNGQSNEYYSEGTGVYYYATCLINIA